MNQSELLGKVDHTFLSPQATWEDIRRICDEGIKYHTATVCIPPCFVKKAKEYTGEKLKICTVIGFPNGYQTTDVKLYETKEALANGADEIDMVIRIGWVKERAYTSLLEEIQTIRQACGEKPLKVIIETCLLSEDEKIRLCEIVTKSGADYIKTSTGFSKGGATFEDIALMKKHVGKGVKIKAAGGISSLKDAQEFIRLGADRLGTSRIVQLVKETM